MDAAGEAQGVVVGMGSAVLWLDAVTVSFDGFRALDELTLLLDPGELRCIIGPNGAGKTTMMDVITGTTRPDSGHALFTPDQHDLTSLAPHEIVGLGIGRKFQRPSVFEALTVYENLELACVPRRGVVRALFSRLTGEQRDRIDDALRITELAALANERAAVLSHGQKQWLEIGMLLVQSPVLLLVDEPVAGMTHQETERTAELLAGLAGDHTVVVVEHDMEFVRSIARQVTVLHEGRVLAEGGIDDVQADPRVIEVYLGEEAAC